MCVRIGGSQTDETGLLAATGQPLPPRDRSASTKHRIPAVEELRRHLLHTSAVGLCWRHCQFDGQTHVSRPPYVRFPDPIQGQQIKIRSVSTEFKSREDHEVIDPNDA